MHGEVKAGPGNSEAPVSYVNPDFTYNGICWAEGDTVQVPGRPDTNRNWVKLALNSGGQGWVPSAYLKGNATGNVPNHCY